MDRAVPATLSGSINSMQKTSFGAVTLVWLGLMLATGLSWSFRTVQYPPYLTVQMLTVGLFLVAMIKVRLVILYFMEVRNAPLILRVLLEGWVAIVGTGLIGMYLLP